MTFTGFELTGGLGGLNPPTSTFQTHYFSKNIDLIDKKPCSTPPPHLLTIRPLDIYATECVHHSLHFGFNTTV